jgi:hypothetical protein
MEDSNLAEIEKHIETHIGKISTVFHEVISDLVHIDVLEIPPTEDRPYWTLVTSGMSDLPMTTPEGAGEFGRAELMLCLPREWKMEQNEWEEEAHYWPVRWLKICARFPHEYKTWLGWGHTLLNGDPPQVYASSNQFCCMYLGLPKTVSTQFGSLRIRPDKTIHFYALYPLYRGELEMKLKKGAERLENLFERNKVTEIVNVTRQDLSARS